MNCEHSSRARGEAVGSTRSRTFAFAFAIRSPWARLAIRHADVRGRAEYAWWHACGACDRWGNTFVSDGGSHRIRKTTPEGAVTTYAGSVKGFADGPGDQAKFYLPGGMACDAAGNLYVADEGNNRIRKITLDRVVTTVAGSRAAGKADRPALLATFNRPTDVAVHPVTGNLAVADCGNHRIRCIVFETGGAHVFTLAGKGTQGFKDGPSDTAKFDYPCSVAYDADGNLYVADLNNNRVRKITPDHTVSTFAGTGEAGHQDGAGSQATFNQPDAVACDGVGSVVVADTTSHRVRLISQAGVVTTLAGSTSGFQDGQGAGAQFSDPTGVAVDGAGNVLVGDYANRRVRRIAANLPAWPDQEATPPPVPAFNADMRKLLDPAGGDGLFHDVSFQIEGDIIHAHKNILSARSEYFATMLASGFAEGASGSGNDAPLMVADTTPMAFRALLAYLYTDTVELDDACVIDVSCLSQRYLVTTLQEACAEYCKEHVSLANAVQWLVAANTHVLEELRCVLLEYTRTHYAQIEETSPDSLDLFDDHPRLFREVVRGFGTVTSLPAAKRHKGGN